MTGRLAATVGVLAQKLQSFALVDPLVTPVATLIGDVVSQLGTSSAKLTVTETTALRGLLELMKSPAKLRDYGTRFYKGEVTVDEVMDGAGEVSAQPVTEQSPDQSTLFNQPAPVAQVPPKPVASSSSVAAVLI